VAKELGGWQMQKTADALVPGDKIIFTEAMGGEGEVLTVESIANYFGTVDITTEELDFDLSASAKQWISIDLTEED
jgi:hydrogenase maturation factor HypE